jgi:predicted ester cyclase
MQPVIKICGEIMVTIEGRISQPTTMINGTKRLTMVCPLMTLILPYVPSMSTTRGDDARLLDHHLPPGIPPNAEGHKAWIHLARAGFPDIHLTIEDMIVEGGNVVARMTVTGTQTGEFMGVPPSGRSILVAAIAISRIVDGKSVEYWETFDALGMMQQIGAIRSPGQSSS